MTPKVGIIGFGMVGGALTRYFNSRNITPVIFDPLKGYEDAEALKDTDIIFVCVPTPYDAVSHGFDLRYVDSAFDVIPKNKIVVIKSTVVPGTTLAYQKKRPDLTVMFNPEFLTESRSDEDMFHPNRQIIGIVKEEDRGAAEKVLEILPAAPFVKIVAAAEAEMLKYFGNAFYALKVAYANQIFDLCQKMGLDYEVIRSCAIPEPMIGNEHLDVNFGGYRGYGGKCLPKDVRALLQFSRQAGVALPVLEAAEEYNNALLLAQGRAEAIPENQMDKDR